MCVYACAEGQVPGVVLLVLLVVSRSPLNELVLSYLSFHLHGAHYSGFLWDNSCGIELREAVVLENPIADGNGKQGQSLPYLGRFYVSAEPLVRVLK